MSAYDAREWVEFGVALAGAAAVLAWVLLVEVVRDERYRPVGDDDRP